MGETKHKPRLRIAAVFSEALHSDTDDCIRTARAIANTGYPTRSEHVMMCEAVNGPKRDPKHEARHLCGNKWCINPKHLRWGTRKQNVEDTRAHGNFTGQKLTEEEVREIYELKGRQKSRYIAECYGVSQSTVTHIWTGRRWKA